MTSIRKRGLKASPFLCYRRSIQKKEHRRPDKYPAQYTVKPACLPATYIPYDKLCVLGGKEPVPIKNCSQ